MQHWVARLASPAYALVSCSYMIVRHTFGSRRLLQDEASQLALAQPLEELGRWDVPLGRQHEAFVMRALVGLVTAVYQSFPTTIQSDKKTLAALSTATRATPTGDGEAGSNQHRAYCISSAVPGAWP